MNPPVSESFRSDEPAFVRGSRSVARTGRAISTGRSKPSGWPPAALQDETQIHTHMCYCEFEDILPSIAALDADVISMESARSRMELLEAFHAHQYPNEIGPGVYDIHSPRVPSAEEIRELLTLALTVLKPEQLWVNPDCGLKTRGWPETISALENMCKAASELRTQLNA